MILKTACLTFGTLFVCWVANPSLIAETPGRPPNIVFILADDLGWRDLGCQGSTFYKTPNIDRLAGQGMRFTNAYAACSVCSPTRASLLTGKYPARLHLTDWLPGQASRPSQILKSPTILTHLPREELTLPETFKQHGYVTGIIGKWHLGGSGFLPAQYGFDVNIAGCELGHPPSYFSPYRIPTLTDGPKGEYLTDRLSDEAEKFLESNKNKPFFLYLAHYAVHNPQQAKAEMISRWRARAAELPPASGPDFLPEGGVRTRQIQDQPVYGAMVESLDEGVGRVLAKLDDLGIAKNTIVIFFSDNGGLSTAEGSPTSNVPLRAGKGWPYEGGVREPLIVRWPGVTRPGSVCETPTISTDFYPTLLEAAGLPSQPSQAVDGASFVSLLKGGVMPERPLFWHYPHYSNQGGPPCGAMRLGDYKLIEWYEDMRAELFNLKSDSGEKQDIAAQMPEKASAMLKQLHSWRASIGADMPIPNPNHKPAPKPVALAYIDDD